jgi:hypothetical protein
MKLPDAPPPPDPKAAISRGRIIPSLIDSTSTDAALEHLGALDLPRYMPFRLVVCERDARPGVRVARWDGRDLTFSEPTAAPMVLASSGLGDAIVQVRLPQFASMLETSGPTLQMQDAFHRFRWPEQDHTSVLMSRPDARTVSITEVCDTAAGVEMHYRVVRDGSQIEPAQRAMLTRGGQVVVIHPTMVRRASPGTPASPLH